MKSINKAIATLLFSAGYLYSNISGIVYKDFNFNGVYEESEGDSVVIGVNVSAVCSDGNEYNVTTNSSGIYNIESSNGVKCRIEVDASSAGIGAGFVGESNNSSSLVSFVDDNTTNDVPLVSPATYCQPNPNVAIVGMPGGEDLVEAKHGTIFSTPLPDNNETNGQETINTKRVKLATFDKTGAIWGLAWNKNQKALYASAVLRRYVPLKDDNQPEASAGAIYKIDTLNNSVSLFATIPNVLSQEAINDIKNRTYGQNEDSNITKYIGREGLGDLDISEDGSKLYTVNLYTKELIAIDASNGDILNTTAIPNPYGNNQCPDSDVRPWAIKAMGGKVYVGSVCESKIEGEGGKYDSNGSLGAVIQEYTGASFNVYAQTNTLRYLKPRPYMDATDTSSREQDQYHNWSSQTVDNNYRAPILTDIEFDNKGNLILGYTDRFTYIADEHGAGSGDIRKMCKNSDGSYTDESTGVAPTNCSSTMTQYPHSGDEEYYEFYIADSYFYDNDYGRTTDNGHPETASGALAQSPGRDSIAVAMVDGTDWNEPGSIGIYSHKNGEKVGVQAVIYNNNDDGDGNEKSVFAGKAGGLGDIEMMCDPMPYIEIGNRVWMDENSNGIQDANESGIADINVTLYCNEQKIGEAVTNNRGEYYFGGKNNINLLDGNSLNSGDSCQLRVALNQSAINSYNITLKDASNNSIDNIDSDGDNGELNSGYSTIAFTMPKPGFNNHSFDFGFTSANKACIGDKIWEDLNGNGLQDAGEPAIEYEVGVYVYDENGNLVKNRKSNSLGDYEICDLEPNKNYYIQFDIDSNDTKEYNITIKDANNNSQDSIDSDADSSGKTDIFKLSEGENNKTFDLGLVKPVCIGNYIWFDENKNGKQDSNESGVSGVRVALLNEDGNTTAKDINGNEVDAKITNSNGEYQFCNLRPGEYRIQVEKPSEYSGFTTKGDGEDDDSDVNSNGISDTVRLLSGDDNNNTDAGLIKETPPAQACIGDKVWEDLNRDGVQDSNESGKDGVIVHLYKDNTEINTTTTQNGGEYKFCDLDAGEYSIKFDIPDGYTLSPKDATDDDKDSDVNSDTNSTDVVTLNGEDILSVDAGIYEKEKKSACVGDFVWNDKNANGIQDSGEEGVSGIKVYLYDGNISIGNDVTDSEGHYRICASEAKEYSVKFDLNTLPQGYVVTKQITGTADGSDADQNSGVVEHVVLQFDKTNQDIDMGIYKSLCLGNFVWKDLNRDGVQDSNESGLSNVRVHLYKDGIDTNRSKITNSSGEYQFCSLEPGKYSVKFDIPDGYTLSPKDATDDDKDSDVNSDTNSTDEILLDSESNFDIDAGVYFEPSCIGDYIWVDMNKDGIQDANESGKDGVVVELYKGDVKVGETTTSDGGKYKFCELEPGNYHIEITPPSGYDISPQSSGNDDSKDSDINVDTNESITINLDGGNDFMNLDGGLTPNKDVGGEGRDGTACLGDFMWLDENLDGKQDSGELGVVGVKVELYDANSNTLLSATHTDNNGKYEFCNLKAGKYQVKFEQPDTYMFTLKDEGDDLKDSDVDSNGWSQIVELNRGEKDLSIDAGIYCKCDDFKVHPENQKELKASTLNIIGLLVMLISIGFVIRRRG